ncbi:MULTISPECIES: UDP-glucose 4-epimerase family protein [unclassified Pseudomonas]|uniref:UDP-glucose 4-epimerase family protein n=1 Tax=unclassified Pseudomonas TaxID=196821 RepID=UPI0039B778DB
MRVLLTGATGFVGRAVLARMATSGDLEPVAAIRGHALPDFPQNIMLVRTAGLDTGTDWSDALNQVAVVIHCAARVHVMNDIESNPLEAFRKVNVEGTLKLARQAASMGVRRFIFISSIKVNGEGTSINAPFEADACPAPTDPYGLSKMEAERGLRSIAEVSGMEVVIIRPTLVYGPGVKANFLNMMRWLDKGIPLPFGAIHNQRSLVALDNLADLIVTCIQHPKAANQTFLVSDGEDLSTTELLKRMGRALGRSARLLPVPSVLLERSAQILGKRALSQRLCGSLRVDITKTRELLGWTPIVSVDDALMRTATYFLNNKKQR